MKSKSNPCTDRSFSTKDYITLRPFSSQYHKARFLRDDGHKAEALSLFEYSRQMRRKSPPASGTRFHETGTAALILTELQKLGLDITTGVAKTGVVALLDTKKPGPVVMLRSDMDALPVTRRKRVHPIPSLSPARCTTVAMTAYGSHADRLPGC